MNSEQIKICVVGDEYVGKTSLCKAIIGKQIETKYIPTIGIDCFVKYTQQGNKSINLFMWDLTGASRFENIIVLYTKSVDVLLFCYSVESYDSFLKMTQKRETFDKYIDTQQQRIIIVATKIDSDSIEPDYETWGREYAHKNNYSFIKTSAKTFEGVDILIEECLKMENTDDTVNQLTNFAQNHQRDKCMIC